ncbi:uncharacterized protein [Paramormyrops kingsleyae]|uniref:uncharacterized protein isoform X1 n=2 Tax=Paramormyrops kingsleyae TaxID=1676925 RepID=UPI003B972E21
MSVCALLPPVPRASRQPAATPGPTESCLDCSKDVEHCEFSGPSEQSDHYECCAEHGENHRCCKAYAEHIVHSTESQCCTEHCETCEERGPCKHSEVSECSVEFCVCPEHHRPEDSDLSECSAEYFECTEDPRAEHSDISECSVHPEDRRPSKDSDFSECSVEYFECPEDQRPPHSILPECCNDHCEASVSLEVPEQNGSSDVCQASAGVDLCECCPACYGNVSALCQASEAFEGSESSSSPVYLQGPEEFDSSDCSVTDCAVCNYFRFSLQNLHLKNCTQVPGQNCSSSDCCPESYQNEGTPLRSSELHTLSKENGLPEQHYECCAISKGKGSLEQGQIKCFNEGCEVVYNLMQTSEQSSFSEHCGSVSWQNIGSLQQPEDPCEFCVECIALQESVPTQPRTLSELLENKEPEQGVITGPSEVLEDTQLSADHVICYFWKRSECNQGECSHILQHKELHVQDPECCETSEQSDLSEHQETCEQNDLSEQCGPYPQSDISEQCETYKQSDLSEHWNTYEQSDITEQCEIYEQSDISEQCETYEQSDISEQCETYKQSDNSEQCETYEQSDISEQRETYEQSDISEQCETFGYDEPSNQIVSPVHSVGHCVKNTICPSGHADEQCALYECIESLGQIKRCDSGNNKTPEGMNSSLRSCLSEDIACLHFTQSGTPELFTEMQSLVKNITQQNVEKFDENCVPLGTSEASENFEYGGYSEKNKMENDCSASEQRDPSEHNKFCEHNTLSELCKLSVLRDHSDVQENSDSCICFEQLDPSETWENTEENEPSRHEEHLKISVLTEIIEPEEPVEHSLEPEEPTGGSLESGVLEKNNIEVGKPAEHCSEPGIPVEPVAHSPKPGELAERSSESKNLAEHNSEPGESAEHSFKPLKLGKRNSEPREQVEGSPESGEHSWEAEEAAIQSPEPGELAKHNSEPKEQAEHNLESDDPAEHSPKPREPVECDLQLGEIEKRRSKPRKPVVQSCESRELIEHSSESKEQAEHHPEPEELSEHGFKPAEQLEPKEMTENSPNFGEPVVSSCESGELVEHGSEPKELAEQNPEPGESAEHSLEPAEQSSEQRSVPGYNTELSKLSDFNAEKREWPSSEQWEPSNLRTKSEEPAERGANESELVIHSFEQRELSYCGIKKNEAPKSSFKQSILHDHSLDNSPEHSPEQRVPLGPSIGMCESLKPNEHCEPHEVSKMPAHLCEDRKSSEEAEYYEQLKVSENSESSDHDECAEKSEFECSDNGDFGHLNIIYQSSHSEELDDEAEVYDDSDVSEDCDCHYCTGFEEQVPTKTLLPQIEFTDEGKICVVIDLDETLVHSSFKPVNNADFIIPVEIDGTIHQVYVLKRPHVDEFLKRMGELFECVLFTASLAKYADPVSDLLDKWGAFHTRLFRESCVFHRGNYVKDLSRLGRELSKVIIVDNSPASYIFHPDNAVPVASWFDDMSDTELLDLIPFFERLSKVEDVYAVLKQQKKTS